MTPQQKRRFQLTFWLVFVVSIGMYFLVLHVIQPTDATPDAKLVNVLWVIALILIAAAYWFLGLGLAGLLVHAPRRTE
jgi:hypothetical protein